MKNKLINFIALAAFIICSTSYANQATLTFKPSLSLTPPKSVDYSKLSWSVAFENLNKKISQEYAFTEWGGINWNNLYAVYSKIIKDAENSEKQHSDPKNKAQYYQALRDYIISLHSTHAFIYPVKDDTVAEPFVRSIVSSHTEGSYGLNITHTSDDRYIASYIAPGGPADQAGIEPKAEILYWNSLPLAQAIANSSLTWSPQMQVIFYSYSPSTIAGIEYEKLRMLLCDQIGKQTNITFKNPGSTIKQSVTLTAIADSGDVLNRTEWYFPGDSISATTLPSGYGYIKLISEDDGEFEQLDKDETQSTLYQQFKAIMEYFVNNNVPGIILDLRGNVGGDGKLGPDFAAFFTQNRYFFGNGTIYNYDTGNYVLLPPEYFSGFYIKPVTPYYSGPVVILTDLGTVSGGEFVAESFKMLNRGPIISFYPNTQGAFSGNTPLVTMPGNFIIQYPILQVIDQQEKIMVDADAKLHGGVPTDIQIPMTADAAFEIYTKRHDVLLDHAVTWLRDHQADSNKSRSDVYAAMAIAGATATIGLGGMYLNTSP